MAFKAGAKSVTIQVKRHGGGALGAERLAIRNGQEGEFWPEPGQTWKKFYSTMNGKFYAERQLGNTEAKMQTAYAVCDDVDVLAGLDDSCKVELADGSFAVKIITVKN